MIVLFFSHSRQTECGFVSLRDVDRCLRVFRWFYEHKELFYRSMDELLGEDIQVAAKNLKLFVVVAEATRFPMHFSAAG
jgi:hypothetical protein